MNRAEIFAAAHAAFAGESTLHIYQDGYVLVVACSDHGRHIIRGCLLGLCPAIEEARSGDGFLCAWVIPAEVGDLRIADLPVVLKHLSDTYGDHRTGDLDRLDDAAGLLEAALAK